MVNLLFRYDIVVNLLINRSISFFIKHLTFHGRYIKESFSLLLVNSISRSILPCTVVLACMAVMSCLEISSILALIFFRPVWEHFTSTVPI